MNNHLLSTLANPVRLRLICCLSEGTKNVSQLIGNCGLSQSAVSQHLARLKADHLVRTRRQGKEIFYELSDPQVAAIADSLNKFIEESRS